MLRYRYLHIFKYFILFLMINTIAFAEPSVKLGAIDAKDVGVVINNYFDAVENRNLPQIKKLLYHPSNKRLIKYKAVFGGVEQEIKDFSIVKKDFFNDKAIVKVNLQARIKDKFSNRSFDKDVNLIFLLQKDGNNWKIAKVMSDTNFDVAKKALFLQKINSSLNSNTPGGNISNYIGCYKDSGDPFGTENRDLNGYILSKSDMTVNKCITLCKSKGFKYAGVEYGTQCFCGNSYGKYGKANNCNMNCSGNTNEICGGFWANSIYSINKQNPSEPNIPDNLKNGDNSNFLDNLNKQDNKDALNNDTNNKNLTEINKDALNELRVTSIELSDTITKNSNNDKIILGKIDNKFPLSVSGIHALIHLDGIKDNDVITIKWISKDAFPKANITIGEVESTLEPSKKDIHVYYNNRVFHLKPGHYALEIFSRNKLLAIKEFRIVESNTTNSYDIPEGVDSYKLKINLSKKIKKDADGTIEPIELTDHFTNSQHKIYATIPFENLKPKTPFSIEWIVVYDGINFNKVIYKQEGTIKAKKGVLKALLTNSQKWPDGVFEVLLRLNGEIVAKKKFTIGNSKNLKKLRLQNINIKLDANLKNRLLKSLKEWMLEAIQRKDLKPLYEHSIHTVRDSFNWDELKRGIEPIFNASLDWSTIFSQTPKSFIAKKGKAETVTIDAVYGGIEGVDILLEGTFYKEDGEWRLLGFAFEPVKQKKE